MSYTIDHPDIVITSQEPVQWTQRVEASWNEENLRINEGNYVDYRPTKLQFHITSAVQRQNITVEIPYHNRLPRTQGKHAMIARYDATTNDWVPVPHTHHPDTQVLTFQTTVIGSYAVFVNHYFYSRFTQRLADEYPNWTKIRNQPGSTGQLFLNYFGMELEAVHDYLEWIGEQKYLATVDVHTLDWIYLYSLPTMQHADEIAVYTEEGNEVPLLETLHAFFYNDSNDGGMLDYEASRFYTAYSYGALTFHLTRNGKTSTHTVEPMDHHLWNALDEFGLLLGVRRLHRETNAAYKERLFDVFRYPAGAHDTGLTNGIARDLNLIHRQDKNGTPLVWKDDRNDFVLRNTSGRYVDIRSLRVDGVPLEASQFAVDEVGNIRIFALHTGASHDVSFIAGIEKFELYDQGNESLYTKMYQADGQATSTLLRWVEYINTVAPVMWDRFNWDEGFWDTIDTNLTGTGYVPNIWDSDISSWKTYTFTSER